MALRTLGDYDAWPEGDVGLLKALQLSELREVAKAGDAWRPYRGYAALYLWHHLNSGG